MRKVAGMLADVERIQALLEGCMQIEPYARSTAVTIVNKSMINRPGFSTQYSIARIAAAQGSTAVLRSLSRATADILERDSNGRTLIHEAASKGWIDAITCLVEIGIDIGKETNIGTKAMHFAAENGQGAMVDHLRQLGQDVGVRAHDGSTPMHYAAYNG